MGQCMSSKASQVDQEIAVDVKAILRLSDTHKEAHSGKNEFNRVSQETKHGSDQALDSAHRKKKRLAIAANAIRLASSVHIPSFPKTECSMKKINAAMQDNLLFQGMTTALKQVIANSMSPKLVNKGEVIINQGDKEAYTFFIVDRGKFEVTKLNGKEEATILSTCLAGR